ncbi:hypothetical protein V5799_010030 [Amblyomma americanum]|uniref:Uncharacterized protein n=1 Tax=Amblyomma americanum TaxID=6943 RepID=A0AAQ4F989_AMBAM
MSCESLSPMRTRGAACRCACRFALPSRRMDLGHGRRGGIPEEDAEKGVARWRRPPGAAAVAASPAGTAWPPGAQEHPAASTAGSS